MCGIVGMVAREPVNQALYDALMVLQHRGQDAAGIVTCDGNRVYLRKDRGLVRDVFQAHHMLNLPGNVGVGHCRYPTAGCTTSAEAQPFYVNSPYGIILAHNGNLTNVEDLKRELFAEDLRHINTDSDSEVLLNVFAHELAAQGGPRLQPADIFHAVSRVHTRCTGGYAVVAMIVGHGLVAFRDPHAIRPIVYGTRQTPAGVEYMVASESVALDVLGFELAGSIRPGEAIYVTDEGEFHSAQCAEASSYAPCIFEFVYLARPDSIIDDVSVHKARLRMGTRLAKKILREWGTDHGIDVVIPIPDSSRTAALPLAYELGVKYREGFVKNRYIGRTFIMPGQKQRKKSVRQKLNAIDLEFRGKTVLLVDDSIVRGTTSKQIIQMARDAGARKVYFASAAPPVRCPNVYGIDMPTAHELIAHGRSEQEVGVAINADRIIFQDLADLEAAVRKGNDNLGHFDSSVFDGDYITGDVDEAYLLRLGLMRSDGAKAQRADAPGDVLELHNAS